MLLQPNDNSWLDADGFGMDINFFRWPDPTLEYLVASFGSQWPRRDLWNQCVTLLPDCCSNPYSLQDSLKSLWKTGGGKLKF